MIYRHRQTFPGTVSQLPIDMERLNVVVAGLRACADPEVICWHQSTWPFCYL